MAESNQVKCLKMQTFTDSTGREWTVFEVRRQGVDRDGWSYVPEGFGSGWLCFESSGLKRRLSPVPDNWRTASRAELMQMFARAQAVTRGKMERADDSPDASP